MEAISCFHGDDLVNDALHGNLPCSLFLVPILPQIGFVVLCLVPSKTMLSTAMLRPLAVFAVGGLLAFAYCIHHFCAPICAIAARIHSIDGGLKGLLVMDDAA